MSVLALTGVLTLIGAGIAQANPVCDLVGFTGPLNKIVCEAPGAAVGSAIGGQFEKIVDSILTGYETMLMWALAWWVKLPTPDVDTSSGLMQDVHDHTVPLQIVGLTFSLMFFGMRMMLDRPPP